MPTKPNRSPAPAPTVKPLSQEDAEGSADSSASPKLSERLTQQIEQDIISMAWPVNKVLGSQAELMTRYGVGRATLREAVRVLEQRGVAAMRPGPSGGLTVAAPAEEAVVDLIATHLELVGVTVDEILETRLIAEELAMGLVSTRIDGASLLTLRHIAARLRQADHRDESLALISQFQHLLGLASRNPALTLVIDALTRINSDYLLRDASSSAKFRRLQRQLGQRLDDMLDAIAASNAEQAQLLIRRWVEESRSVRSPLEPAAAPSKQLPAALKRLGAGMRQVTAGDTSEGSKAKLAQQLARALQQEIRSLGWPVGLRLGSEAELARCAGVSASIFREASSLLQAHGVLDVVSGRAGGLVVGRPSSHNVRRSAVLYLNFMRLSAEDYLPLRHALLAGCARLSARRHGPEDLPRLQAFLAQPAAAQAVDALGQISELQCLLAQATHNRVLAFVQQMLEDLLRSTHNATQAAMMQAAAHEQLGMGFAAWIHASNQLLLEMVLQRNEDQAARLAVRQLSTLHQLMGAA